VSLASLIVNVKVRTKIAIGFGFVLVLLAVVGGMGVRSLGRIARGNDTVVQRVRESEVAGDIVLRFAIARRLAGEFSHTGDPVIAAKAETALQSTKEAVDRGLATITSAGRLVRTKEIAAAVAGYAQNLDRVKGLLTEAQTLRLDVLDKIGTQGHDDIENLSFTAERDGAGKTKMKVMGIMDAQMDARMNVDQWLADRGEKQLKITQGKFDALTLALRTMEGDVNDPDMADLKEPYDNVVKMTSQYADGFLHIVSLTRQIDSLVNGEMTTEADQIDHDAAAIRTTAGREQGVAANDIQGIIAVSQRTSLALVAAGLILGVAIAWLITNSTVRPIRLLTAVTTRLANSDWATDVPGTERADELGTMAKAVAVFKTNGMEAERLRAEQGEMQRQAELDRRRSMHGLADAFESKVGGLVSALSSAATELQATAQSMTGIAKETTQQTTAVAAAAEQASVNVQIVAAAAEQLAASVDEISRQVMHSAEIAGQAVEDARHTDAVVRALAEGAQKIGEVVSLISHIAGQTNLLALNATIEAARGRRRRKRLRGRGVRGQRSRRSDRQSDRADQSAGRRNAECDQGSREFNPGYRRADRRSQRDRRHHRDRDPGAGCRHPGNRAQRSAGGDRHAGSHDQHCRRQQGRRQHGCRSEPGIGRGQRPVPPGGATQWRGRAARGWGQAGVIELVTACTVTRDKCTGPPLMTPIPCRTVTHAECGRGLDLAAQPPFGCSSL
jgi:methyl-accepting chemotaxis protein